MNIKLYKLFKKGNVLDDYKKRKGRGAILFPTFYLIIG
jgi:hypothetical protein